MNESLPKLSENEPAQTFFKRFNIRQLCQASPLKANEMVLKLQQYEGAFVEFLASMLDGMNVPPVDQSFAVAINFAQHGDWYVSQDKIVGLILITDRPGERAGQILPWRVTDEQVTSASEKAFAEYGYKKLKAEVPEDIAQQLERCGFRRVGVWENDTLIGGMWLHIIALELGNPNWIREAGEALHELPRRRHRTDDNVQSTAGIWRRVRELLRKLR